MNSATGNFTPFAKRMKNEALPDIAIKTFEFYYNALANGKTGMIPERDIIPVKRLPNVDNEKDFPPQLTATGKSALAKTIMLKLNGGLGTSMGLEAAKSLLKIRDGCNGRCSFLDIIARQAIHSNIPLVLMNSFSTQQDSLAALEKYPELHGEIPLDFLQHKIPKIVRANLSPASWPKDTDLEWCPPGHGDIYTALVTKGMLSKLLNAGYKYAFVSNVDNLGAVVDPTILGYFVENKLPFMMEVADRTEADKKGGHLAQLPGGQLILRELAQCPPEDEADFQNISRHKYFNTNNLWINLSALQQLMVAKNNILELAMIRNAKTVDPRDKNSTPVFQLETAMGSAIAVFKGSGAVQVSKTRFAPIKKTNDLLDVRSDNYVLTEDFQVVPNPARKYGRIVITLDSACYQFIDDFEARFPAGVPSLVNCERLTVEGDIKFGKGVTLKGVVNLVNKTGRQVTIEDNLTLGGNWQA